MNRRLAVLRPEPGNAATADRAEALGFTTIRLPLFVIGPIAWQPPDPAVHDALILTSANAVRQAGPALAMFRRLPVLAVGEQTAAAARDAGFTVAETGHADAAAMLARAEARGIARALHLGARERTLAAGGIVTAAITVYGSDAMPIADVGARLAESVALLHSARAARRLGELIADRGAIRLAGLSPAIVAAAGPGWAAVEAAAVPTDAALLQVAAQLAD